MGLNVGWAPEGAARLGDDGRPARRAARRCSPRTTACPADVDDRYRAALGTLGRRVRIELPDGVVEGTATDVEPDGRLVVLDTCGVTHRLAAGDVVHLRPA